MNLAGEKCIDEKNESQANQFSSPLLVNSDGKAIHWRQTKTEFTRRGAGGEEKKSMINDESVVSYEWNLVMQPNISSHTSTEIPLTPSPSPHKFGASLLK